MKYLLLKKSGAKCHTPCVLKNKALVEDGGEVGLGKDGKNLK
jgi:hypothetical protein